MTDQQPQRPRTDDRDAWKAYWKPQRMPWRTEPKRDVKRQHSLSSMRVVPTPLPANETRRVVGCPQPPRAPRFRFLRGMLVTLAMLTALLMAGCQMAPLSPDLEQRPLHMPALADGAQCPMTPPAHMQVIRGTGPQYLGPETITGDGPVYLDGPSGQAIGSGVLPSRNTPTGSAPTPIPYRGVRQIWLIAPNYAGPVLIRGQRLDGKGGTLLFSPPVLPGGQSDPTQEIAALHLIGGQAQSPVWTLWSTHADVNAGCYGYQVDGDTFSYVMVVRYLPAA